MHSFVSCHAEMLCLEGTDFTLRRWRRRRRNWSLDLGTSDFTAIDPSWWMASGSSFKVVWCMMCGSQIDFISMNVSDSAVYPQILGKTPPEFWLFGASFYDKDPVEADSRFMIFYSSLLWRDDLYFHYISLHFQLQHVSWHLWHLGLVASLKICGAGQLKDPAAAVPWNIFQHLGRDIFQILKNH